MNFVERRIWKACGRTVYICAAQKSPCRAHGGHLLFITQSQLALQFISRIDASGRPIGNHENGEVILNDPSQALIPDDS